MSRLGFFHASQDDIKLIKQVLAQCGLTEDDIQKKPLQYFKRRVRRTVPPPEELERDFVKVVNLFADLKDAKSGKPLFGDKA